ncbi:MAG: response regulator, partial [Bacteroidales bacterium]|nr:response regulator [Bacteroidales bacterium]
KVDGLRLTVDKGREVDGLQLTVDKRREVDGLQLTVDKGTLNLEPETLNGNPIVLIVEDNADLRLYIRGYLDQTCQVIEAKDGKQGLERAIENMPDLIISDVMMPEMDGFELCGKLKTDQRTSHIPVILLTARAGMESKIEGLETGADDFITKPFDPLELQTRVRNLIKQRQLLREAFGSEIRKGELSLIKNIPLSGLAEIDHTFIKKAYDVVEQNLSDPEFNVEIFGQEMAISRVHLHRKLKALINHTATEFIRTLRLNKAAGMLARKSATISEIAYDVGFNTVPYFTKCFQDQFGMTPSAYSEQFS